MRFQKIIKKKKLLQLYKTLIKPDSLCFDIGANMGYKSTILLYLKHHVIAFEPQKKCYEKLLRLEQKYPNFKTHNLAIGFENTELELHIGNHIEIATLSQKFKDYFTNANTYWNKKKQVKVVTLNSQIERFGIPDFCKIDTEGYEYEILENLNYKIPLIEFEFTGGFIEETLKCISKLDSLGSYKFNYINNEKPKLKHKHWLTSKAIATEINNMNVEKLHGNIFAKLNES